MNPTCKKFISFFLVFSLMMLSTNLYAKKRQGAKLIITKKNGQKILGELITVKLDSLLLLDTDGKDVSIDIEEIKVIRIVKKSKLPLGTGLGLLAGGGMGAIAVSAFYEAEGPSDWGGAGLFFIVMAVGTLIGAMAGVAIGKDKTIQIEGMTDLEIRETLDKLRKKARIRDYK